MSAPDFAQMARDMYTDSCGEITHVEIESALRDAYNAGLERGAEIADAHTAPAGVPAIDYDEACANIAAAIRAEKVT